MTRWIFVLTPFLLAASCETKPVPPAPPVVVDAGPDVTEPDDAGAPDSSAPPEPDSSTRCGLAAAQAIVLGCPPPGQGAWSTWREVCDHQEERGIDMQADKIQLAKSCAEIDAIRRGDVR